MIRRGNTTIVVTLALCVVLCVAMACGTVIYLGGKPGPTPDDTKPKARLAELVPDADSRARLSAFFSDFAAVITQDSKPLRTTGDFREAYQLAIKPMKTAARLPDVKAIDEPISQRISRRSGWRTPHWTVSRLYAAIWLRHSRPSPTTSEAVECPTSSASGSNRRYRRLKRSPKPMQRASPAPSTRAKRSSVSNPSSPTQTARRSATQSASPTAPRANWSRLG